MSESSTPTPLDSFKPLNEEEIERVRSVYKRYFSDSERLDIVCDMALASLSLPAPCGHPSQYTYSEDGGAHMVCLLCERQTKLSEMKPICGCIETYPQLIPGRVSHGPGCPIHDGAWVAGEKAKADAYEDAARCVEKIAEDYTHEHGSYDGSTNAWELHHRHAEYIEALDAAVEAIRKIKAEKCHVTQAARVK